MSDSLHTSGNNNNSSEPPTQAAIVEADVVVGAGSRIAAHAIVRCGSELGARVTVDSFAVVGGMPQMRSDDQPAGRVKIGDGTVLREGVTVHRATRQDGFTTVGADCFLMAQSHVGHDCTVGNSVTLANNVMLGVAAVPFGITSNVVSSSSSS